MRVRRRPLGAALLLLGSSCATGVAPEERVRLRVTSLAVSQGSLQYDFELVNGGAQAIFVPTCGGVALDFALATSPPDRYNGQLCLAVIASPPHRIGPGETLAARGAVGRHPGIAYEPSIEISFSPDRQRVHTVRAPRFVSP